MSEKKIISIVTPCFNEADNILELNTRITEVMQSLSYDFEHIYIDNSSTDGTVEIIKAIALHDKRRKLIVNARNFGHIRSPYHGIMQSSGDACILIASDLQDPPELIEQFYQQWQKGYDVVYGRRVAREGNQFLARFYKMFYRLFRSVSYVPIPVDAGDFSFIQFHVLLTTWAGCANVEVLAQVKSCFCYCFHFLCFGF